MELNSGFTINENITSYITSKYDIVKSIFDDRLKESEYQLKIKRLQYDIILNFNKLERAEVFESCYLCNIDDNKCNFNQSLIDDENGIQSDKNIKNTDANKEKYNFMQNNNQLAQFTKALVKRCIKEHREHLKFITRMISTTPYMKDIFMFPVESDKNNKEVDALNICKRTEIRNELNVCDLISLNDEKYIILQEDGGITILKSFKEMEIYGDYNYNLFPNKNYNQKKIFPIKSTDYIILIADKEAYVLNITKINKESREGEYDQSRFFSSDFNIKIATGEYMESNEFVFLVLDGSNRFYACSYGNDKKVTEKYDFDALYENQIPVDAFLFREKADNYVIIYSKNVILYDFKCNFKKEIISIQNIFPDTNINCAYFIEKNGILLIGLQNGILLAFSFKKLRYILQITFKEPILSIYMNSKLSEIMALTSSNLFLCMDKKYCLFHEENLGQRFDSFKITYNQTCYTFLDKIENKFIRFEKPSVKPFRFLMQE